MGVKSKMVGGGGEGEKKGISRTFHVYKRVCVCNFKGNELSTAKTTTSNTYLISVYVHASYYEIFLL